MRGVKVCSQMCERALSRKQTLGGGSALDVGDLRLLENGSERRGAHVSDLILSETVSERWRGDAVREQACQRAVNAVIGKVRAVFELACVLEAGEGVVVLQRLAQRVDALGGVGATASFAYAADLVVGEAAKKVHARGC